MVDNNYRNKEQLSNGVWVVPDGNKKWGGELNHNFELLNDLLTNYTLTVKQNGTTVATFNRTADVTANIDTVYPTNNQVDILFPGYQGEPVSSETPNEKTEVNYSSLIRYTNNLKSVVVTDVSLNENTMTFKYLDNTTKDIELPVSQSSGTELPTKSVTRVPLRFKINFYIADNQDNKEKIALTPATVKDIVKVYRTAGGITFPVPVLNVSEVSEESDAENSVFMVSVNVTPKDFHTFSGNISLLFGDSFGNLSVQSNLIKDSINNAIDEYNANVSEEEAFEHIGRTAFSGQVIASSKIDIHSQTLDSKQNCFEIDAVIRTSFMYFDTSDNKYMFSNDSFCWAKDEDVVSFAFDTSLESAYTGFNEETFTAYDL